MPCRWLLCRLWPSADAPEPWQGVVRQLYGHLPNKPLLWTAAHGGQWLAISQCVFPDAACLQQQPFHLLTAGEAQQSLLQHNPQQQQQQQQQQQKEDSSSSSDGLGPLGQALLLLDMPLLDMPAGVLMMLQKHLVSIVLKASFLLLLLLLLLRSQTLLPFVHDVLL
jgi:hypothetical protein